MRAEHILIMRFSSLGDVAMTVPVVYSLARQYPDLRITMLSRPFARPLFEGLAPNVSFMEADVSKEYKGIRGLNALYRRLTAKHFTAVADLHGVLRSEYLRMRFNLDNYHVAHVDKHRAGRKKITQYPNKVLIQQPTVFQNCMDVFDKLGYPITMDFTSIFSKEGVDLTLLTQSIGIKQLTEHWIGIAPFAAHAGKVYPLDKTEEAIKTLTQTYPTYRIFLFGHGGKESAAINDFVTKYNQCINVSATLGGLSEELILISHLDVMLSMDSANMHLASLTNTPVVSIWGATHPYLGFMGWNQDYDNAVQADLDCRPCSTFGAKTCMYGDYRCLNNITPQMVVEKLVRQIET